MLVSLYYRPECLKSAFYRIVLREMTWEVSEYDVSHPGSAEKLLALKKELGNSGEVIIPAIHTNEVYSHEILPTIEYFHERNPAESMYPDDPLGRLLARSLLHRTLRTMNPLWERILNGDALDELVAFTEQHEEMIAGLIKKTDFIRSSSLNMPSYVEILFALIFLRKDLSHPIQNPDLKRWLKKLTGRESFKQVVPSFLS